MPDRKEKARERKQKGGPKAYAAELVWSIVIAVVLAMVIRTFLVEAFKIPTKSMEPTLIGDEGYGDRVLAGKWAYRSFFGVKDDRPKRWEVAVFIFRDAVGGNVIKKNYIKRCVGLPNEQIATYRGDLYIDGKIERKPDWLQDALWHPLYDDDLDGYDENRRDRTTGDALPWRLPAGWSLTDGGILAESAASSEIVYDRPLLNLYVPPRPYAIVCPSSLGGCGRRFVQSLDTAHNRAKCPHCGLLIPDAAWNGIPDDVRRTEKSIYGYDQKRPVGDLRVSFDLLSEKPGGSAFVRIRKDDKVFTFALPLGEGQARLASADPRIALQKETSLACGRSHRVRLSHYDERLVASVDGSEIFREDYHPALANPWPAMRPEQMRSGVSIGVEAATVRIDNIRIERDIYYLLYVQPGSMHQVDGAWVRVLNEGEYWMMGDNSPASRDSRDWGPLKESDLIGRALVIWWPPDRMQLIR